MVQQPQWQPPQVPWQQPGQYPQAPQWQPPGMYQPPPPDTPDPKAVDWLRNNRWFGDDEEMTGYAYGVHEKLVKRDRIDPRSNDYYVKIDEAMRHRFPEKFDTGEEPPERQPAQRQAAAPRSTVTVAPPSRGNGAQPRKVQLTETQARVAKRLGLTLEQYAEQVLKEQANG
jgi:hypothetical protein